LNYCQLAVVISLLTASQSGCAVIGPSVVRAERTGYNEALHDTSAEQLLLNIIRAKNQENPSFSNFAEVDAQPSTGLNLTGGSSNIGAVLPLGALTSSLSASETSIQKHVSVTGYELIQQISKPITLQNIYRLADSNAPTVPLFTLSFNRLGRNYMDFFSVIDLLYFLDRYGALLSEARTENTLLFNKTDRGIIEHPTGSADDSISCIRKHNLNISSDTAVRILWKHLSAMLGNNIILRTPEAQVVAKPGSELEVAQMHLPDNIALTRSALGALQNSGFIKLLRRDERIA
jgi:hypothetical protein